ncbi:DUF2202 domain-containing protein [Candidatus Marithrix sp. Canyon 246]|uniref:DUF2202 domain-containing protein n=2 Tax=Candidatus Marithrix sp. Canyon 246 TaxID=1827136 RepID=UPI00084A2840|nr:DUF2202 domain-containing protein [Candidatus Marithrix sp. Canyon 246]
MKSLIAMILITMPLISNSVPLIDVNTENKLSETEIEMLSFMREEEKMARDVYISLYDAWQIKVFQNISRAEQQHMDQVKFLMDSYGLSDPVQEPVGVFTNADIQKLYDSLVKRGKTSKIEALRVGGLVEEVDIKDLQQALAATNNPALQTVYTNLMNGSYNHLNAFVRQIESLGETYKAQYLLQYEVDYILNYNVANNAKFKSSLNNGEILSQNDEVTIAVNFEADTNHIGQTAELFIIATWTSIDSKQSVMLVRDEAGNWKIWDGNFNNISAAQAPLELSNQVQTLNVYKGSLPAGRYQLAVGYRLSDGTIIFNGQTVDFSVE